VLPLTLEKVSVSMHHETAGKFVDDRH